MKHIIIPIVKIFMILHLIVLYSIWHILIQSIYFFWEFRFLRYSEVMKKETVFSGKPPTHDKTPIETLIRWWKLGFDSYTHREY